MTDEITYNKIKCEHCDKEFAPKGIFTHLLRIHGTDEQKSVFTLGVCADPENTKTKIDYRNRLSEYSKSPVKCKQCDQPIEYSTRYNIFCGKLCSGKYNGIYRTSTAKKTGPAKKPDRKSVV